MTDIDASLSKALETNYLLLGNDLSEGWDSQYSGNHKSLFRFLPEKFIKKLPPQAESSLRRGNSVNSTTSSDSSSSSFQCESLFGNDLKVPIRVSIAIRGSKLMKLLLQQVLLLHLYPLIQA